MEWYYIAGMIVLFVLCVGGFVYLRKNGYLTSAQMVGINAIFAGLSGIIEDVAKANSGATVGIIDKVVTLVQQAALAAENDWYNNIITKEERRERCMQELCRLFEAYNIVLTDSQWDVIDVMVRAACELMGHNYTEEAIENN